MERLPNRYPKISQSHKVPLYKGLSLFYPKLVKNFDKYALKGKKICPLYRLNLFSIAENPPLVDYLHLSRLFLAHLYYIDT